MQIAEICGICANICEFLNIQHMQHNFCLCDFENAEKYAIRGFWQNMRSNICI